MSHPAQVKFIKEVRNKYPHFFYERKSVVDVGSLDINGSNKRFFTTWFSKPVYEGIDIIEGKNVDIVGEAHLILPAIKNHWVVISTECLEHDQYWEDTMKAMYNNLIPGGLLLITAGGDGREEHGTTEHHPWCSPATNDYYRNISNVMFDTVLPPKLFTTYFLTQNNGDLQFYGIKAHGFRA